jgi:catalase
MANTPNDSIKTRQIAILAAEGVDSATLTNAQKALLAERAQCKLIAPHGGFIKDSKGVEQKVDMSFLTTASVLFDAVYVPGGEKGLLDNADAIHFINEAYRHCKPIATDETGLLNQTYAGAKLKKGGAAAAGIVTGKGKVKEFIEAIKQGRFWEREVNDKVPA